MLSRLSSSEYSEWKAYYSLEPFGEYRADLRTGMMAAPLINLLSYKGKKVRPGDFILDADNEPVSDPEAMKLICMQIVARYEKANS